MCGGASLLIPAQDEEIGLCESELYTVRPCLGKKEKRKRKERKEEKRKKRES